MLSELLILTFSAVLFLYWLRYNCILILRTDVSRDLARRTADANNLSFFDVQGRLSAGHADLDESHELLRRDYRVLSSLLRYTTASGSLSDALQLRILAADFRLMQLWYLIVRRFSPRAAGRALEEKSRILAHFAQKMGQRSAAVSRV